MAKDGKIQLEFGQTYAALEAMVDSGDNTIFNASADVFSGKSGYTPDVRPDGIVSGRDLLTPLSGSDDAISYAAFTAYIQGVLLTVSAGTVTSLTRPVTTDTHRKISIILSADGNVTAEDGVDSTAFSTTRGANGGPPLIPADAIEIGQVWLDAVASDEIAATEIYQTSSDFTEFSNYPTYDVHNTGKGKGNWVTAEETAHVKFKSALPDIHDTDGYGSVGPKNVYITFYEPEFSDQSRCKDFKKAAVTGSISSTALYGEVVGFGTKGIGSGGFTALLDDGINDSLVFNAGEILTVKFFEDENKAAYVLTQGIVTIDQTFPADNFNQATATISAEKVSANFTG